MTDNTAAKSCCAPAAGRGGEAAPAPQPAPEALRDALKAQAVAIPGGASLIGTNRPELPVDGEAPLRRSKIKPFRMGATAVTNAQFAAFVEATGHVTEAERFGWSFVFWQQVPEGYPDTQGVSGAEWWRRVDGADWRNINGPGTGAASWHADHPVVHVSWNDARAYAAWAGGRLPTEAEWEHAARGGLGDVRFPWGEAEPDDTSHQPCNIWQGRFPHVNTAADGFLTTAPAQSFAPNGYGLSNMVGNTWEWTADAFTIRSLKKEVKAQLAAMKGYKLMKGGSFLCHASYCYRYRIAARTGSSPDSTTTHQGFRVVWPD
ncbi:formylglycine-generating enzyme family protein [Pseudoruegeria sp. SHC-113]|uniref:formylglycine-generating enzyme family protein n=1 Tax=Pseudoruegeria sp. SHC-113 TaxID=2855439 RepID=UPI0021BB6843|nr:formylglycine-generating enzyme family protein [Pseudoruegeria sp. SHC-113]MCT8158505.1 formylglycine-generating enzyme family protein [Pseudoruegeria sp. SHC-113]